MKIVLIGAGNLATHLGKALHARGHNVVQVYSRTESSAQQLAMKLDAEAVTSVSDISCSADLYVLALTDKAIESLLPEICLGRRQGIFVHTSGSLPMTLFCGHADHFGVVYPMQTFSKARDVDFSVIPCFVEASDEATLLSLENVCHSISTRVQRMDSDTRRYLHLSAVFACNFANHCFEIASRLLQQHGLDFSIMHPLIDETVAKVHEMPPVEAQTGPAVRYDRNIIDKHLQLLDNQTELKSIYKIMSDDIHKTKKEHDKL